MRLLVSIFLFTLIFSSCSEDEQLERRFQEGTYTGTFHRNYVWDESDTATITMAFEENRWNGTSDKPKYPALCRGTYSINGNKITFQNECPWTAEFDWSLILSGEFILEKSGGTLEFSKDGHTAASGTYIDQYRLVKD